ncbi:MAG: RNA polymerase sigma factor [Ardenticatenaceae bacterium]|nr:RNA polymerase sigma factor [Ardenticatenaceae bacterium]
MTDAELIAGTKAGDVDAFRTLFERYKRQVFGTAIGITNDRELAEEILQDCFLRVHQYILRGKIDPSQSLGAWLHRVAVNRSCDELRRARWRRLVASIDEWAEFLQAPRCQSPEGHVQRDELRTQLLDGLGTLDPLHRAVLILYYLQGFSIAEVATILECPEGTVKRRLHTARKRLRALLERNAAFSWELIYELA